MSALLWVTTGLWVVAFVVMFAGNGNTNRGELTIAGRLLIAAAVLWVAGWIPLAIEVNR